MVHGEGEEVSFFDFRVGGGDAGEHVGTETLMGEFDGLGRGSSAGGEEEESGVGIV